MEASAFFALSRPPGETGANLLAVPEQSVLVLANLDGGAAKLDITTSANHVHTLNPGLPSSRNEEPATFHQGIQGFLTVGISTRSPACTPTGSLLPSLSRAPGPTARTLASLSSLTLDSGRKMPDAVLVSALMRWTRTRSRRGTSDLMDRMEVACFAREHGVSARRSLGFYVSGRSEREEEIVHHWELGQVCARALESWSSRGRACAAAPRRYSWGRTSGRSQTALTILNAEGGRGLKGRLDSIDGGNGEYAVAKLGRRKGRRSKSSMRERETARKKLMTNGSRGRGRVLIGRRAPPSCKSTSSSPEPRPGPLLLRDNLAVETT